ncbi:MAG: lysine exporter LysO family protein [Paludibacteraceae bacterium]|nr:lysine exporter LysO family protein [Bacteroidia bacterium]HRG03267.1 lysine exporter LysO family protein [Paludibacteraceae bacterium]
MKSSLIILSFFALGLLLGVFRMLPQQWVDSSITFYVLCLLMFSVGLSLGHDKDSVRKFRSLSPRLLLLPAMTVLGTFLGVTAVSVLIKGRTFSELLAVSSGFGYYSLSSVLITQYKGVELGAIALLANIIREVITLLFAPWMVRFFGPLAPVSAGGATTMDTTFPVIIRNSGKEFSILSIYHGFITDLSVPFLVTFFCSL